MRKHLALVAAVTVAVALANVAYAAPKLPRAKPLVITDPAGDANGINGQGRPTISGQQTPDVPSQSTPPAQRSAADIVQVALDRVDDTKMVKGLKVTMKLSAAPDRATVYRVVFTTAACAYVYFDYIVDAQGQGHTVRQQACSGAQGYPATPPAKVTGTTIEWLVLFTDPGGNLKVGTELTVNAQTRGYFGRAPHPAFTVPQFDETAPGVYKIGQ